MKKIEQTLGVLGFAYFLVLICLSFFAINFLIGVAKEELQPLPMHQPLPPTYDFKTFDMIQLGTISH